MGTVAELLATEDKWTKGAYALDANGLVVTTTSTQAQCFCLAGAMIHLGYTNKQARRFLIDNGLVESDLGLSMGFNPWRAIVSWNDKKGRTYSEVIDLVRKAGI